MNRPTLQETFLFTACAFACRSTCLRRKVGAVITIGDHIAVEGYNGPPRGFEHCVDLGGCRRELERVPSGERMEMCRATHAEMNAIAEAARRGRSVKGGTIYITTTPCSICANLIAQVGIKHVVFIGDYPGDAIEIFNKARITWEQVPFPEVFNEALPQIFKTD
jgi:dCMP deaminase